MADAEAKVKAIVEAEDKTGSVFADLGKKMGTVERSSGSLTSGLKTLGIVGASLWAGKELLNFLLEAGKLAYDDEKAVIQLNGALSQLGTGINNSNPAIKDFENSMLRMGQTVGNTDKSLTKLIRVTGDVEQATYLSKLAADLAASGMGDLESNTSALVGLYQGRARAAAQTFGIDMRENTTAGEALNEIIKRVTVSTEDMASTTVGQMDIAKGQWEEFKSKIGEATVKVQGFIGTYGNALINMFQGKDSAELYDYLIIKPETANKAADSLQKVTDTLAKKEKALAEEKSLETLNNNIKSSFRDLSKNIVQEVQTQIEAIDELKKSMQDLDDQTSKSLAKSDKAYQKNVTNLAKKAQDRITEIEKEIKNEQDTQSAGFRSRIEELEKEKIKEQTIIDRAGGVVTDIKGQIAKDDLTILQEEHAKEIQEIKDTAEKKKLEMQKEQLEREIFIEKTKLTVQEPGFYEKATKEGTSFLGNIGAGTIANSFIFNFNGDVNDKDALQKSIIDALNRIASLRQIGVK